MNDIIVDWGSTNFRAFLVKGDNVIDKRSVAGNGVLQLYQSMTDKSLFHDPSFRSRYYSDILKAGISDWLGDVRAIYMCGAIGSREGWLDTGYTEAPANIKKLADNIRFLNPDESHFPAELRIGILPGLATAEKGRFDMMRSEEVKSFGALSVCGLKDGIFCIPGTHCKWVVIRNEVITGFHSILTGEIYNTLQMNGSLAPLLSGEDEAGDEASFDRGLALAGEGYDLLSDIWQLRAQAIRAKEPPEHLRSYLSGILIGHEIRQAFTVISNLENVVLLSDLGPRQKFYKRALEKSGLIVTHSVESEAAVCEGMLSLWSFCKP